MTVPTSRSSRSRAGTTTPATSAQHDALVGRDAAYRHIVVSLGGGIVRINTNVRYAGPGGDATLLGVYFADAGSTSSTGRSSTTTPRTASPT